ncbi:hypothetical protein GCM10010236_45510 [Streptomyces eurythermus]|nr:hypothetical protein GCM10010236_45510 [Streptomyces eurythermus]
MMRRLAAVENIQFPTTARADATSPEASRCSSGPSGGLADVRPMSGTDPARLVVTNQLLLGGPVSGKYVLARSGLQPTASQACERRRTAVDISPRGAQWNSE